MVTEIGKHRVKCGNLMDGISDLMQGEKADIFYSDPPWGKGLLKYWQTLNSKMNNAPNTNIDFESFLNQMFSVAVKHTKKNSVIFVEYGYQWAGLIIHKGENAGLMHLGTANPLYKSGSKLLPMNLHVFAKTPISITSNYLSSISGTKGIETLRTAIKPFAIKDKLILDPACGLGYTAKIAIENKMIFYGNEINKKRLDSTINLLRKGND